MQDFILFTQHHWPLSLLFAVLVLLLSIIEFIRTKRGAVSISSVQLTHMVNHQQGVIIDIRPTDLFIKGHIIGSLSLSSAELKINTTPIEKMKSQPIILVCSKGLEALKLAPVLKSKGFHVHILKNGISGWTDANMPLTK